MAEQPPLYQTQQYTTTITTTTTTTVEMELQEGRRRGEGREGCLQGKVVVGGGSVAVVRGRCGGWEGLGDFWWMVPGMRSFGH